MATNDIQVFAGEGVEGTDVLSTSAYTADTARPLGSQIGLARRELINKVVRQSTIMSAAFCQMVVDYIGADIVDSGEADAIVNTLVTAFLNAVTGLTVDGALASTNGYQTESSVDAVPATGDPTNLYRLTAANISTSNPYKTYGFADSSTSYGVDKSGWNVVQLVGAGTPLSTDMIQLRNGTTDRKEPFLSGIFKKQYANDGAVAGKRRGFYAFKTASASNAVVVLRCSNLMLINGGTYPNVDKLVLNFPETTFNAAAVGLNGLDTGSMPSTGGGFLGIYAVYNPTTQTKGFYGHVFTRAENYYSPRYTYGSIPSGYTYSALVAIFPILGSTTLGSGYYTEKIYTGSSLMVEFSDDPTYDAYVATTGYGNYGATPTIARKSGGYISLDIADGINWGELEFRMSTRGNTVGERKKHYLFNGSDGMIWPIQMSSGSSGQLYWYLSSTRGAGSVNSFTILRTWFELP